MLRHLDCDHMRDYVTRTNYACSNFHFRTLSADTFKQIDGWGGALFGNNWAAYGVGSDLKLLLCYLRSLLATDFGQYYYCLNCSNIGFRKNRFSIINN